MSEPVTTMQLLQQLKQHFSDPHTGELASDGKVARILGIGRGGVSAWRTGRAFIGEEAALKVAEILGMDPQFVLASLAAERARRAQNVRVADAWTAIAKRVAAVAIVGTTLLLPFPERVNASERVLTPDMHYAQDGVVRGIRAGERPH